MNDEYFMGIALEEARNNVSEKLFPVGAVIVLNGEVIAKSRKTDHGHQGHAEIHALRDAYKIKKFEKNDQIFLYSTVEPCLMCYATLLHTQIKKIVYAIEDPWAGGVHIDRSILPLRYHDSVPEVVKGVMREESRKIIKEYAETSGNAFWEDKNNPLVALTFNN